MKVRENDDGVAGHQKAVVYPEEPVQAGPLQEELVQNDGGDGENGNNREPIKDNEGAKNDYAGAAQQEVLVQHEKPVQGPEDEPFNGYARLNSGILMVLER